MSEPKSWPIFIFMGCSMKPVKRQLLKFTKSDKTIRREARSRIPRETAVIFEKFKFHAKLPSFHLNAYGARSQIHIWSTPSIFGGLWAPLVSCMYFSEINGLKKPQLYNENKIFFLLKNIKREKLYKLYCKSPISLSLPPESDRGSWLSYSCTGQVGIRDKTVRPAK